MDNIEGFRELATAIFYMSELDVVLRGGIALDKSEVLEVKSGSYALASISNKTVKSLRTRINRGSFAVGLSSINSDFGILNVDSQIMSPSSLCFLLPHLDTSRLGTVAEIVGFGADSRLIRKFEDYLEDVLDISVLGTYNLNSGFGADRLAYGIRNLPNSKGKYFDTFIALENSYAPFFQGPVINPFRD